MIGTGKIIVFQDKKIRRIWYDGEWYFSVVDVVAALTESANSRRYWSDLKISLRNEGFELYEIIVQLKLPSKDGKLYATDCANTKSLFRIIQSIPSKKAEPFKQWLAKVGYERIEEIENPEKGHDRIYEYYRMKDYPEEWIEKRLRGIAIRQELTKEWKNRDINSEKDFAILTNEINKASFGKTISEHKELKGLDKPNQNLRDHMTDLELIFNMLGEKSTTEITKVKDSYGLDECKISANLGGNIARRAREDLEKTLGRSVVSEKNYLDNKKKKKDRIEDSGATLYMAAIEN